MPFLSDPTDPTSNSFCTVAFADDYHSLHNNTLWAALNPANKQAALLYATTWIAYGPWRWFGAPLTTLGPERLPWPRQNAYSREGEALVGYPDALQKATAELALAHSTKALNAVLSRGGDINSVTIGPISVGYGSGAAADREWPMVKRLLKKLHLGGVGGTPIVRG